MLYLFLIVIAYILVVFVAPLVFLIMAIFVKDKESYFRSVALGLDQVGGSVLYAKEDWTVSSWTHYLCVTKKNHICKFELLINVLFGKEHCIKSYLNEQKELKFKGYSK